MGTARSRLLLCLGLVLSALAVGPAQAQSTYGLAARQTIPVVIAQNPERIGDYFWSTQIEVYNPRGASLNIEVTFFGAANSAVKGRHACQVIKLDGWKTANVSLANQCGLAPGFHFGRLELSTVGAADPTGGQQIDWPHLYLFLAKAVLARGILHRPNQALLPGPKDAALVTVDGIPQGQLSGNSDRAVVTGLKHGMIAGELWESRCYASSLNEGTAGFVSLADGSTGMALGGIAGLALYPDWNPNTQPPQNVMDHFKSPQGIDVFSAVGAPPGAYTNVTAYFSTSFPARQTAAGMLAFCWISNLSTAEQTVAIAKYVDNNDDGRDFHTPASVSAFGYPYLVHTEIPNAVISSISNLHVAYFQHPDVVKCMVETKSTQYGYYTDSMAQIRLLDPEGNVVAGGPHAKEFLVTLGEKSTRNFGRNGRWLIEVAPDDAYFGSGNPPGQLGVAPYVVLCSSGGGHNQLDMVGHCTVPCQANGPSPQASCGFTTLTKPLSSCWN